ncbi:hypothetical protein LguiA_001032 [Lonicera macranthoides]
MNVGGGESSKWKQCSIDPSWQYKKEGIFEIFPAGLRVLVVDDDRVCLVILEKMLKACLYEVTKRDRAEDALSLLREKRNEFDIIISDVHMPDMDGLTLLELVGLEMDLPVIMISADDDKNIVMKGVTHGACDYLIKPVRIEALRNIWQHVVRKRKNELMIDFDQSQEGKCRQKSSSEEAGNSSEGSWRNPKRNKDEESEPQDRDNTASLKKPRVVWSVELHQQFVQAVNQLGLDKAVPKKILELMSVPGLTRENVASHLQKYRLYLRRVGGVVQHPSGFINSQEGNFGSVNSLNGLDLQISSQNLEALIATGQISPQELAALGRSTTKSALSVPQTYQRNLFTSERFQEDKQQNNKSNQIDLLRGIPTSMEPNQLTNMHPSTRQFGCTNMRISQSSSVPMQFTQQQPIVLHNIGGGVLGRNRTIENAGGGAYNPASSVLDFSMNQSTGLSSSSFSFGSSSGISALASEALLQNEANMEMKVPRALVPSYDNFNEMNQQKSQEWNLHNPVLGYNPSQNTNRQGTLAVSPLVLVHQGFISTGQNRNSSIGKGIFSPGEGRGPLNAPNIGKQMNMFDVDNPVRVKTESLHESSYQHTLYPDHFSQEDLLSAILKQQQEGMGEQEGNGELEDEFGFMGFSLDNLPM